MNFSQPELAVAAVFKRADIIHKTSEESPGRDVIYKEVEKKKCDVEGKMAAPLSTMKFWKPGKY